MQIAEELRRKGKTRSDSLSLAGERFANSSSKNQPSLRSLLILIKKMAIILPTGQWYAPSAVINVAWYCMVLHGYHRYVFRLENLLNIVEKGIRH